MGWKACVLLKLGAFRSHLLALVNETAREQVLGCDRLWNERLGKLLHDESSPLYRPMALLTFILFFTSTLERF